MVLTSTVLVCLLVNKPASEQTFISIFVAAAILAIVIATFAVSIVGYLYLSFMNKLPMKKMFPFRLFLVTVIVTSLIDAGIIYYLPVLI